MYPIISPFVLGGDVGSIFFEVRHVCGGMTLIDFDVLVGSDMTLIGSCGGFLIGKYTIVGGVGGGTIL